VSAVDRDWLVACVGAIGTGRPAPAPPDGIDWPDVLVTAEVEDLAPALAHALAAAGWPGVPPAARRRLTDELASSRARHLLMSRELAGVLRHGRAAGIAVIVLKGAVLAEAAYPDPALRPFSDLDLLVRSADRFRMDAALRALGHRRVADEHSWDFDVAYDGATLYETPGGVRIDLHWALLTEPRFLWNAGEAEIWERSVPITVAGEEARGLGREDLVLYLAAHLAVHHTLTGLRRYHDLARVLQRDVATLDWTVLLARAARWRIGRALFFALLGARSLFEAPVPPAALAALRPRGARARLLATLVRRSDDRRLVRLEHLVTLLLVDRARDVVGALRKALWPSAGWMRARYGLAAGSAPALYRAHARRLGRVVHGAAAALTRRDPAPVR
jgi:hypothetical protein